MVKGYFFCFFFILCSFHMVAQYSVSGSVRDQESGEDLIGVTVFVKDNPSLGTVTNPYGFYSISLSKGQYTLVYSYVGYQRVEKQIDISSSMKKNVELLPSKVILKEVEISAEKENENIRSNQMSVLHINPKDVESVPVLFGEPDLMKTIQLLPGVSPAGEGQSGFFVRGGSPGQNLVLLDEATVYNASHLLGFFSVFNSAAIKSFDLYKGAIPSRFGGRLSSVVDIKMKEGDSKKKLTGQGGIGTISSKLNLEGVIKRDKGSFMVSGRRTYLDAFAGLSPDSNLREVTLYFYDVNAKANYRIGENDRLFISGYIGRDKFESNSNFGIDWGNRTLSFRWNHIFSDKLFLNTSYITSDFDYKFFISSTPQTSFSVVSNVIDNTFKTDFNYYLNNNNKLDFGFNMTYRIFVPGEINNNSDGSGVNSQKLDDKYNLETALYIQNEQKLRSDILLKYGLRYTNLAQFGPGTIYSFDERGDEVSSRDYKRGEVVSNYHLFAPRFAANYVMDERTSLKFSYSRTYQTIHLISNPSASTPFDSWLPSSNNLRPSSGDQFALGYFRNFKQNTFKASLELYYKNERDLKEYKTEANIVFNPKIESGIYSVKGRSYGAEFLIKKEKGRFTGWVSYTLSKTERQHEEINEGSWFPSIQDRRHDISVVLMYGITDRLKVSGTFVYYTGRATTFSSNQVYVSGNNVVPYYTGRNLDRFPDYHRLDLGITFIGKKYKKQKVNSTTEASAGEKKLKRIRSEWNLSFYNVYARENPYQITFQTVAKNSFPATIEARFQQLSLFRIVPALTWKFKF